MPEKSSSTLLLPEQKVQLQSLSIGSMEVYLPTADATEQLAQQLASHWQQLLKEKSADASSSPMVVWLEGDLGAGKSTLVRAFLRALGVQGSIRSPTYTLLERYPLSLDYVKGEAWHLDLYRIADYSELDYLGLDDPHSLIWWIEWAKNGEGALPPADLQINLSLEPVGKGEGRCGVLSAASTRGERWLDSLLFI